MEFIESTTESSRTLTVKLNKVELSLLADWSNAARIYPGAKSFDSDSTRFSWFCICQTDDTEFDWIDYGGSGTLGGIPILGIPDDRSRHYIAYAAGKGLNVLNEMLMFGLCRFVDIPSLEARLNAEAAEKAT